MTTTGQVFNRRNALMLVAATCFSLQVFAQSEWHDPWRANQCFKAASQETGVPYRLLLAIKRVESGPYFNPMVTNQNRNGSTDIGLLQINTIWLPQLARFGVTRQNLHDPCINVAVASRILAYTVSREQDWGRGIARYHTGSSKSWDAVAQRGMLYASKVMRHYEELNRINGLD